MLSLCNTHFLYLNEGSFSHPDSDPTKGKKKKKKKGAKLVIGERITK